jgi:DNA-binding FadR family transcriptional regulator
VVTERIVRKRLSDEVFARLRKMIQSGEFKTGDEMPSERELMERFGVGRPAVREALLSLANKGLIKVSHGERARVREITAQSIINQVDLSAKLMLSGSAESLENLKNARIFFEQGLVRVAAKNATPEDVAGLRKLLDLQKKNLGNSAGFIKSDMALHVAIAKISRNPIFPVVAEAMLGWLEAYHTEMLIWTGQENFTLEEHAEIVDAIAAADPIRAEQAMIQHLERSRALFAIKNHSTATDS